MQLVPERKVYGARVWTAEVKDTGLEMLHSTAHPQTSQISQQGQGLQLVRWAVASVEITLDVQRVL